MSPDLVARLALYFSAQPSRPGILARMALGQPGPHDPELALELRERLAGELRPDGSVGGAALPTIWRVHELLDLGEPSESRPVRAAVRWLGALQGRSGAFGEGCDKQRHARRVCEHFLAGFFSPAPPGQRLTPVTLPNGKVFRAEPAARFALSTLALRAMVRAGESSRPPVRRHLESLARFAEQWTGWVSALAPDAIVAGMHALAEAGPPWSDASHRLLPVIAERQGTDGGWSDADLFPMLDMLLAAGSPDALALVSRALPALAARQRPDGSFGATAQQERALVGLRAALRASQGP
ncbi:MAG TPA: hypothetical protein VJQ44_01335 [Gemmatimonadales bacterium]|nr:hypothetical protein [Gemmatimonadales bacterium]